MSERPNIEKKQDLSSKPLHENQNLSSSTQNVNAKLANPLSGLSHEELIADGQKFAMEHGLEDLILEFQKGALIAQDPTLYETLPLLDDQDRDILRREITHKWDQVRIVMTVRKHRRLTVTLQFQPMTLYYLVALCSVAAAVQGASPNLFSPFEPVITSIYRWTNPLSMALTSFSRDNLVSILQEMVLIQAETNGSLVS